MRSIAANRTLNMMISIVLLVLLSSMVTAIGVAPSKRVVEFSPGKQIIYDLDIVNNGEEDLEVLMYARGDLSDDVKISQQMLKMAKSDKSKQVKIAFRMPDSIQTAGQHEIDIVAVGSTPVDENAGAVVKADIAVISKLIIDVPYPDKYAEARVYVLDTEKDKPIEMSVPVFNKGDSDIEQVYVTVDVYDSEDTLVEQVESEKLKLRAGKDHKFVVKTARGYPEGEYKAVAKIYYDGSEVSAETYFSVGELKLDVRSLVVDTFTLGSVARFDILLYNSWSTPLKNVYAEMQIIGEDNQEYTSFRTVATDVKSKTLGRLEGYWNTEGVVPGIYTAKVTLFYANKISQKEFELEVQPNKIITREKVIGKAISDSEEVNLTNNAYLILIILAMAGIIAALVFKLNRKGKTGGGDGSAKIELPALPQLRQEDNQTVEDEKADKPAATSGWDGLSER